MWLLGFISTNVSGRVLWKIEVQCAVVVENHENKKEPEEHDRVLLEHLSDVGVALFLVLATKAIMFIKSIVELKIKYYIWY